MRRLRAVLRQDVGGEQQILVDRQRREDVLGLRHEGEAVADLLVRRHGGDVGAAERRPCPEWIGTRPAIALTRVDLPAPFGPSRTTSSPARTAKSTPRTIGRSRS